MKPFIQPFTPACITRMHSSRMRTGRLLPYLPACTAPGGCTWSQRGVPGPMGLPGPGGMYLPRWGVPSPWGCTFPGDVRGPRGVEVGVYLPRGVTCPGTQPGNRHPPVNRMTNRCKNITLPQTSFAGGKNINKHVITTTN